ncbi:TonB-dependent siderophore receptor [Novosphingobium sp. PC22D]|uniref:TonB-dependent receptor n=1 Tax=Novosphingobium sp. PC22D TaxID=1962403 RepID=UPI000BF15C28|nr:TonB-dependent siderophore receptor [Novosphingobium sp. PC22D]PEQ14349.1 TonB-dependent siderophore receptor [Novosphingobium sp. PC22D]
MKRVFATGGAAGFLAVGCVGFIAVAAQPVMAQTKDGEPTRLEGMTVTDSAVEDSYRAEQTSPKATAPLVDTPRIITVVSEAVIRDSASFTLEDALRTVPGITLGAGEGGTASADIPLIRGIDSTGSVFVDGLRDIGSQTREIFALEQIEVTKGPNSAFGGRGTAGGSINLVSKVARAGVFAEGQVTAGTSDLVRVTADANVQLNDKLAVRIVGMYHDSDVPGRDAVFDDRWGVLPSITWGVGSPISATLSYYHYETDAMPDYGIPLTSRDQLAGGVREPADVDRDNFYGLLARDFQKTKTDSVTFEFNGDLGGGLYLSNTTRYNYNTNAYIVTNPDDSAGNVANGFVWRNIKSRNSWNKGLASNTNLATNFDTGSIEHALSFGFEMAVADSSNAGYSVATGNRSCADEDFANYNCTSLDNPDPSDPWNGTIERSTSPSTASAEEYSFYLFDTVTILPQLLLNGGIRWTDFSAKAAGCGRGGCYDAENSGDFFTWQAGVVFKPSETTSIYASYADSKNPPGTTVGEGSDNLGSANETREPQSFENWEVGAKAELMEGNLLLSAAAFRIKRNNIIQTDGDVITDIFDAARLQGFELGVTGQAGPVSITAGYTYVDSELRANDNSEIVGNVLPQTPKHNFSATVRWQATPQLAVGGGAYGASKRYADAGNSISADGYARFDAFAEYKFTHAISARLNVQNIADERYIVKIRNPHFAVPAAGRQALLTISAMY